MNSTFRCTLLVICAIPFVLSARGSEVKWLSDPSMAPLPKIEGDNGRLYERYRIVGDFDGDGKTDMALSFDIAMFGNAGGMFTVYLGDGKNHYREYGQIDAHRKCVAIEKSAEGSRLWTYLHGSATSGEIGYYELKPKGISEYHHLTIHPGDGGTRIGEAVLEAVFSHSDVKLTIERSETQDGKVTWNKLS